MRLPWKNFLDKDQRTKLDIYGYPAANHNYDYLNKQLTKMKLFQYGFTFQERLVEANPAEFKIAYDFDTILGGMSGCPVVADNKIIGIHNEIKVIANIPISNKA